MIPRRDDTAIHSSRPHQHSLDLLLTRSPYSITAVFHNVRLARPFLSRVWHTNDGIVGPPNHTTLTFPRAPLPQTRAVNLPRLPLVSHQPGNLDRRARRMRYVRPSVQRARSDGFVPSLFAITQTQYITDVSLHTATTHPFFMPSRDVDRSITSPDRGDRRCHARKHQQGDGTWRTFGFVAG